MPSTTTLSSASSAPNPKENVPGYPAHTAVKGHLVFIRFGSIGRGILPLIERHINYDTAQTLLSSNHLLSLHTSSKSTASSTYNLVSRKRTKGNNRGNVAPTWHEGHGHQSQCRCQLRRCHGGATWCCHPLRRQCRRTLSVGFLQ